MKEREKMVERGPVRWLTYDAKLDQLDILFGFISYAFSKLSQSKREGFVKHLKHEAELAGTQQIDDFRKRLKEIAVIAPELTESFGEAALNEQLDSVLKKTKAKFRGRNHTQYAEWVNDGLVSAEILFRVTLLEDFLKHVHAAVLFERPKVLATANPKKQADFNEVFSDFNRFKEAQIDREVDELNRQGMDRRLDYFKEFLAIDFGEHRESLLKISALRNRIAHGNPLHSLTKADTDLPLDKITVEIAKIIKRAMEFAFQKAQENCPDSFLRR